MFIMIPISRLHIEDEFSINNITICSKIFLENHYEILIEGKVYPINTVNKNFFNSIEGSFAIYQTDEVNEQLSADALVEKLIQPVDQLLDCLRLDLNSFTFHEQVIGTPGLYGGNKVAFILTDNFELHQIIEGKAFYYNLSEGIGCDAVGYDLSGDHILVLNRSDEVYIKYRGILHRLLKSIQAYDTDSCFAFLFSIIEGMDCIQSDNFTTKKIRILSFISENKETFDMLSQQFYFYSKIVRTYVIHGGKSLRDLIPWERIYSLLDDLYLLVVKFCTSVINCGATTFLELEQKINLKCNLFEYSHPTNDIKINEMPSTHAGKCSYFAELSNLNIDKILKIGDVLIVPSKGMEIIFTLRELYEYGLELCEGTELAEEDIIIDSSFPGYELLSEFNVEEKSLTLWDIDIILTTLLRGLNIKKAFAILPDQPYWQCDNEGFNFKFSCEFSDVICNKIQESINYLILFESFKNDSHLPSKVGINNSGIRAAYFNPDDSSGIYTVLGRVYGEYIEPPLQYIPNLANRSDSLYTYFCSTRNDEVFLSNRKSLTRIAESIYFDDINEKFLAIFDALEVLYPTTYDGKKLIKRIATFSSASLIQKNETVKKLTNWRDTIRNPLLHGGKAIYDLNITYDEVFSILDSMRRIIVSYCENVYCIGIQTFEDMKEAQMLRNKLLL